MCSICSYQRNSWYGCHVHPSLLLLFLQREWIPAACPGFIHECASPCTTAKMRSAYPLIKELGAEYELGVRRIRECKEF